MNDVNALAIVIDANSQGGSPSDSQAINDLIVQYKQQNPDVGLIELLRKNINTNKLLFNNDAEHYSLQNGYRKPIIAVINKMCASACLQAIINADIIIAQRASLVGNIGVRLDSVNWAQLAKNLGVTQTTITSGQYKAMLDPWSENSSKELRIAKQMLVDPVFNQFAQDVLKARGDKINIEDRELFSGLVWAGKESVEIGLIDLNNSQLGTQVALEKTLGVDYLDYTTKSLSFRSILSSFYNEYLHF